jgi:hypothetical protein
MKTQTLVTEAELFTALYRYKKAVMRFNAFDRAGMATADAKNAASRSAYRKRWNELQDDCSKASQNHDRLQHLAYLQTEHARAAIAKATGQA